MDIRGFLLTVKFRIQSVLLKFANLWVNSQRIDWSRVSGTFTECPDAECRKEKQTRYIPPHQHILELRGIVCGRLKGYASFPDLFPLVDPVARCLGTIYSFSPVILWLSHVPTRTRRW